MEDAAGTHRLAGEQHTLMSSERSLCGVLVPCQTGCLALVGPNMLHKPDTLHSTQPPTQPHHRRPTYARPPPQPASPTVQLCWSSRRSPCLQR